MAMWACYLNTKQNIQTGGKNMTIKEQIEKGLKAAFVALKLDVGYAIVSTSSQDGVDYQCNSSFNLAKSIKDRVEKSPIDFAKSIVAKFKSNVSIAEAAGAGFINFKSQTPH